MDADKWQSMVFRLEGLPAHIDTHEGVATLLGELFVDLPRGDIKVRSLATSLHHWISPAPRVATLQLGSVPAAVRSIDPQLSGTKWDLPSFCECDGLTLDSDFLGLTPLNDVDTDKHAFEYVSMLTGSVQPAIIDGSG